MTTCTPSGVLATEVGAGCAENPYRCYQCKRCTAGCPVAEHAGMHPAQIMRAVQLGQYDMIFDDKFIWLCTGCQTCTTRCPQSIDIAAIMDELKIIAWRDGKVHPDAPSAAMLKLNYDSFVRWGRMWEVELIARDALRRPKGALEWLALGPKMLLKGKINPTLKKGDTAAMERMVKTAESLNRAREAQRAAAAAKAAATTTAAKPAGKAAAPSGDDGGGAS
jgi:heterodisulfide reductase subunit C